MRMLGFLSKFSEREIFCLEKKFLRVKQSRSLKGGKKFPQLMQSNVRELRENRRRLRHCNGYNFQCHRCQSGRRNEVRCRSQDTGWIALVGRRNSANFSAKRRMRPAQRTVFVWIPDLPSFLDLWNEGFFISSNRKSLNRKTGWRFTRQRSDKSHSTLVSQLNRSQKNYFSANKK